MPNYLNFDLHIDKNAATGEYTVKVLYSPAGEMPAPIPFRIPFSGAVLENHLLKLKLALRNAGLMRASHTPTKEELAVQEFGTKLFTAAFADKALSLYDASRTKARSQGCGLRVRLRISPPELAALPWEFLYNPDLGDFVCLNVNTPLIRYLEMGQEIDPLLVQMPLNVLAVSAQPDGVDTLSVEREKDRIRSALGELSNQGLLYVGWLDNPSLSELQAYLRTHPWHVLHFMGHGGFDAQMGGVVVMRQEDDTRYALIAARVLGRALENAPTLRLVFLNACETSSGDERDIFSSTAATLARRGIPAVLAMQFEVTDAAAIAFARTFYESVATGQPIDTAVSQARVAITARSALTLEWGTPVLTMRSSDGVLFEVEKQSSPPRQPSPPTPLPQGEGRKTSAPDYAAIFEQATQLYNDEQYVEALLLLKQLSAANYRSRIVGVMLPNAEKEAAEQAQAEQQQKAREARRVEIQGEYDELADYLRLKPIPVSAYKEWQTFQNKYPEWFEVLGDPRELRERLKPPAPPPPPQPTRKRSVELLPAPFAWIKIPAGKVTLKTEKGWAKNYIPEGKTQTFDVPAFEIAKYPLTNDQFAPFIEAGGYTQDRWWTTEGLEARRQGIEWNYTNGNWEKKVTGKAWTEPRDWQDPKWNKPDYPVVGVSWFESVAYCQWLRELTGELVRLPTEQEWQRAAQGDTNWAHPWGDTFDKSRCNNSVDADWQKNSTSPVTRFEGKGDSPFGVVDMAGNVWEWCLTAYESGKNDLTGTDVRVLRGGSWSNGDTEGFRCDYRGRGNPGIRDVNGGFRLALS